MNLPEWVLYIVVPVILLAEFFLGRTELVKPNSLVAVILDILKKIATALKP